MVIVAVRRRNGGKGGEEGRCGEWAEQEGGGTEERRDCRKGLSMSRGD